MNATRNSFMFFLTQYDIQEHIGNSWLVVSLFVLRVSLDMAFQTRDVKPVKRKAK